ncbi:MAG TPA: HAD family hydrolase [Gammaproteobacteria bacterium]|nr:HAD family hydrolase [Gammaproteobacteria bacterium]
MSSVELLCFDLDDTLWAATPVLLRAEALQYAWLQEHLPRLAAAHDIDSMQARRRALMRERPALAHDFTALRRVAMAELCAACGYDPALGDAAVEVFLEARSAVTLFEEVDEVLRDLRRNYRLASLTNGNTDLVRAGVAQYFDYMLSPADTGCSKPDPRMFEAVMARAGVAASAMVHIGDQPWHDIEGAHRAQVRAVWLNRDGRAWPEGPRRAHAEIASLRELRAALEGLQDTNGETSPA